MTRTGVFDTAKGKADITVVSGLWTVIADSGGVLHKARSYGAAKAWCADHGVKLKWVIPDSDLS